MIKILLHGCCGAMGRVITSIAAEDNEIEIVAGIDKYAGTPCPYPVYPSLNDWNGQADAVVDFSAAAVVDELLDFCESKKIPVVLCTTGLSESQLKRAEEVSKSAAVLRSANMSLGVNLLLKLVAEAAKILAGAGFDMEIVEKHHNQKKTRPAARHWRWQILSTRRWIRHTIMYLTEVRAMKSEIQRKSGFLLYGAVPSSASMM